MASKAENIKMHKKNDKNIRKVVNNLEPGWIPPDGGWGWIIVIAAGFCNVFILSFTLCFGLVFRERLQQYGISTSQTTTIINVNAAVGSFVGLMNGPLYRNYTFRQATCVGGLVCSVAICILAFIKTFYGILFFYSILHTSGQHIVMAASGLSLIPYFTEKRRIAVGFAWVLSGLGNIFTPQIVTLLMQIYGAFGTIILFGGISLHTIVCAVLLQPVQMNAKRSTKYENMETVATEHYEKSTVAMINGSKMIVPKENVQNRDKYHDEIKGRVCQRFGGDLHDNGEENEMETLLMTCTKQNRICRQSDDANSCKRKNTIDINEVVEVKITNTSGNSDDIENHDHNSCEIMHENNNRTEYLLEKGSTLTCQEVEDKQNKLSWLSHAFRAGVAFFDLDLLRDYACVNIIIAVSFVLIIEINIILLTPFILADYGLTVRQIAVIMSIVGGVDVLTRLIVCVVASRIGWENITFMLIGVGLSTLGRAALAHANTYNMILAAAIMCSVGKGMCFIFSALVLPDHVSLEKLPAATGLHLMLKGILFLAFGPIIGWLRETSGSYTIPLHFLNIFTYYVIISKIIERWYCSSKRHRLEQMKEARV